MNFFPRSVEDAMPNLKPVDFAVRVGHTILPDGREANLSWTPDPDDNDGSNLNLSDDDVRGHLNTLLGWAPLRKYAPYLNFLPMRGSALQYFGAVNFPAIDQDVPGSPYDGPNLNVNSKFSCRKTSQLQATTFGGANSFARTSVKIPIAPDFYLPTHMFVHSLSGFYLGFLARYTLSEITREGKRAYAAANIPPAKQRQDLDGLNAKLSLNFDMAAFTNAIVTDIGWWNQPGTYGSTDATTCITNTLNSRNTHALGFMLGWQCAHESDGGTPAPAPDVQARRKIAWALLCSRFTIGERGKLFGYALTYGLGLMSNSRLASPTSSAPAACKGDRGQICDMLAIEAVGGLRGLLPSVIAAAYDASTSITKTSSYGPFVVFTRSVMRGSLRAMDVLLAESYAAGYQDGFKDGYAAGYAAGWRDGYAVGYMAGYADATKDNMFSAIDAVVSIGTLFEGWTAAGGSDAIDLAFLLMAAARRSEAASLNDAKTR
jgi:hypothetical protein